jgi:hypothetical protein
MNVIFEPMHNFLNLVNIFQLRDQLYNVKETFFESRDVLVWTHEQILNLVNISLEFPVIPSPFYNGGDFFPVPFPSGSGRGSGSPF